MQASRASVDQLTGELYDFLTFLGKSTEGAVFELAHELDLSLSQLRALFFLTYADAPLTLTELAPMVHLSVAATGRLLDGLVRAGLLVRSEDEADRRVKRLTLTPHGEEFAERFATARRAGLRTFVQTLTGEQRERFSRALAPVLEEHR